MILSDSPYRVLGVDVSYRDTGYSIIELRMEYTPVHGKLLFSTLEKRGSLKNPPIGMSFSVIEKSSKLFYENTHKAILDLHKKADLTIIEMPFKGQDYRSLISIGICWGSLGCYSNEEGFVFADPSFLKHWSNSKPGDKKSKVKEKVISLFDLEKDASNDNIVDAVGISSMFCDLVRKEIHESVW